MRTEYKIDIDEHSITCYEGETLLQAIHRQNVKNLVYGCFGGGCGRCIVHIKDGTYDVCKTMSNREGLDFKNTVLACCIKPNSNMKITISK